MTRSATIVTSVHHPDDPRIRHRTAQTLVDAGWAVTYVAPLPGPASAEAFTVSGLRGPRFRRSAQASAHIVRSKSDVVVVNDPELLPAAIVAGVLRGSERVVFDLHEDLPAQLATRRATPGFLRRPSAALSRWLLRIAERTVTITLAEPQYERLFRDPHPVFENRPVADSLPKRAESARGIVYVGDVTIDRGARLLVEAAMGLAEEVDVTFIGRCAPTLIHELDALASDSAVQIEFTGFLAYDEAWERARHALVGVSPLLDRPNYRESLPTKLDEYRSVGLITVASALPGSVRAVADSGAVLTFEPGNVHALTAVLERALEDQDLAVLALIESDAVRGNHRFDAERFVDFYETL